MSQASWASAKDILEQQSQIPSEQQTTVGQKVPNIKVPMILKQQNQTESNNSIDFLKLKSHINTLISHKFVDGYLKEILQEAIDVYKTVNIDQDEKMSAFIAQELLSFNNDLETQIEIYDAQINDKIKKQVKKQETKKKRDEELENEINSQMPVSEEANPYLLIQQEEERNKLSAKKKSEAAGVLKENEGAQVFNRSESIEQALIDAIET